MKYTLTINGEALTIESEGPLAQDVVDNIEQIWPDAQSVEVQEDGQPETIETDTNKPENEAGLEDGETEPGMANVGMGTGIKARAGLRPDRSRIIARDGGD